MTNSVEIDSKSLSMEEREKVGAFIKTSNFFNLKIDSVPSLPDQFQYNLTIEFKDHKKNLEFGESQIPDSLRPLVDYLMQKARKRNE